MPTTVRPTIGTDAETYQRDAAVQRVRARAGARRKQEREIERPGGIGQADSLERVATRIDRLSRILADPPRRPIATPKATRANASAT
ncbi:MAG: hypothetical protein JWQ18_1437, partial [Conexibacter sp.]|nr:hypothetical protein [Conexibacter sp.]